jgi:hypothetical protein
VIVDPAHLAQYRSRLQNARAGASTAACRPREISGHSSSRLAPGVCVNAHVLHFVGDMHDVTAVGAFVGAAPLRHSPVSGEARPFERPITIAWILAYIYMHGSTKPVRVPTFLHRPWTAARD